MKAKKPFVFVFVSAFLFAIFFAFQNFPVRAEDDVDDLKDDIERLEKKAEKTEAEINELNAKRNLLSSQLNVTKNLIIKTETEIQRKQLEVENTDRRIELNKKILEEYIRELYYSDQEYPLAKIIVADSGGEIFENIGQIMNAKEKVLSVLEEIKQDKMEMETAKQDLAEKKDDHEKLLNIQKGQQYEVQTDIKEAQATLDELNSKINKLKGELSKLLGSEVSFKNILDAAAFASKVTGIRKDYLLGVLVVESNLGRYTGGCTADKSKMSSYRLEIFKNISKELGYDWKKRKVSCPPSGYKGTGGAMGVAQFMSDTWGDPDGSPRGYRPDIAAVTGHNPPDPWDLTDGVVAMALKLTKVDGVKQHKKSAEAKAYCIYLAGGNWAAYCDNKGVNYGDKVLYWADNYEQKLGN